MLIVWQPEGLQCPLPELKGNGLMEISVVLGSGVVWIAAGFC
jgi:hypothetical protein